MTEEKFAMYHCAVHCDAPGCTRNFTVDGHSEPEAIAKARKHAYEQGWHRPHPGYAMGYLAPDYCPDHSAPYKRSEAKS